MSSLNIDRAGIEREVTMIQFDYKKFVVRTSIDLVLSSFSSDDGGVGPGRGAERISVLLRRMKIGE